MRCAHTFAEGWQSLRQMWSRLTPHETVDGNMWSHSLFLGYHTFQSAVCGRREHEVRRQPSPAGQFIARLGAAGQPLRWHTLASGAYLTRVVAYPAATTLFAAESA